MRQRPHIFTGILTCFCFSLICLSVNAAGKKRPPAYLHKEEAGKDYQLQGEYRGSQRSLGIARSARGVGLQVIALGNHKFIASKYYGGLPGAGWHDRQRFKYSGERAGDIVRLEGSDYSIEVDGEKAIIFSKDGSRVGELRKVHRESPTMGAKPPPGAVVLFSGDSADKLVKPRITEDGLLREGTQTAEAYGDMRLHAEFRLPFKPLGRGQDRGNSGFYLQGRYEVQVLDSFGLEGVKNQCGAIYKIKRPDVNMCFPPLSWQTYDIDFTMPRFDAEGNKTSNMQITIWQNGVLIQDHVSVPSKTGAGIVEGPNPLPTKFQDHGNPVEYRNIWLIPKTAQTSSSSDWVQLPLSGPPTPITSYAPPGLMFISPTGSISLNAQCP